MPAAGLSFFLFSFSSSHFQCICFLDCRRVLAMNCSKETPFRILKRNISPANLFVKVSGIFQSFDVSCDHMTEFFYVVFVMLWCQFWLVSSVIVFE